MNTVNSNKILNYCDNLSKIEIEPFDYYKILNPYNDEHKEQVQLITKKFYDQYFEYQDYACAYEIGGVKQYRLPVTLESIGIEYVPQSFVYVGELELC